MMMMMMMMMMMILRVCVCVCKHLGTRWNGFSTILQQGAGEGGGGSPANEDTPPHPVKTYLLFRQIAGAKLRTLSIDLFSRNYNFSDDELF